VTKTNPKLPGMPGPSATLVAIHEQILLAVAALHRALTPLAEQLPPGAESAVALHFNVQGDSLSINLKPHKEE